MEPLYPSMLSLHILDVHCLREPSQGPYLLQLHSSETEFSGLHKEIIEPWAVKDLDVKVEIGGRGY